jgi:L-arabinokinase
LDSGIRHAVSGADYGSVRAGAFMGYRIIAELAGLKAHETTTDGLVTVDDPTWNGYLANISPSEFEQSFGKQLPESIVGAEFLSRYRGTTDPVTQIDPSRSYPARAATSHAVFEHHRVRLFSELIAGAADERRLEVLGKLMYQSHESYSACGLGSGGTDRLVDLVREAGPRRGLYGAKITGGGSGGTVAVLGTREAGKSVDDVAAEYQRETAFKPLVFSGSSPGSAVFGHLRLKRSMKGMSG